MKLVDLFPPCPLPLCAERFTASEHHHIAPAIADFFTYPEMYQYIQGGVGSGKTTAVAAMVVMLTLAVPGNEGIIFRKDLGLNYKSSWKAFQQCVAQLVEKGHIPAPKREVKKFGEYTKYTFHNGSIVYAGQTKNISEYMGPDYGWIWIDDAMESPVTVFLGEGTVGGLQSRLRGAAASFARYKGRTVDLRRFFITTNPPPGVSEWWTLFGKTSGVRCFPNSQTQYRHTQLATADNPFLPADYIETLAANHTEDEIARILGGQSVIYYGGHPVYKGYFNSKTHVASFLYDVTLPLLVSWDFGFQHPAIIISQIRTCPFDQQHIIALSEITTLYNLTVWELYERGYQKHIAALYNQHEPHHIYHCCDISGFKKSSSNRDKRGDALILQDEYDLDFIKRRFELEYSLSYMAKTLQHRCKCGFSPILIDRQCEMLIEAYSGGYRYPRKRDSLTGIETYGDKPVQDHRYEDPADAHRYSVENFLRYGLPATALTTTALRYQELTPAQWLEGYDAAAPQIVIAH